MGRAVVRNRVRRRTREAVRLLIPSIEAGWDVLFVARPPIAKATYSEIASTAEILLQRAGLIERDRKRADLSADMDLTG